jgi:acyl CoA:acetate/3-ketoacid CoA transferase beta subunit
MMITNDITHVSDVTTTYGKAPLLSKEEIEVVVRNSQAIEGYKPASIETRKRVQALMEKHSVKVSF